MNDYLLVGEVVSTHGIKGELKVNIITDDLRRYNKGNTLYVENNNGYEKVIVSSFRVHKNMGLLIINNLNNINDVLSYVNKKIYIKRSEVEDLPQGEYYYDDLIGLNVIDISGGSKQELVGIVKDVIEVPQGCILRIERKGMKDALVPYVDEFINNVDLEEKTIEIKSIEGLL